MLAIYQFGSIARGDNDTLSDKDILIITDNLDALPNIRKSYQDSGYTVSYYSPRSFKKMASLGSLFVQHIKNEGLCITDQEGWMKDLLSSYKPKEDYTIEILNFSEILETTRRFNSKSSLFCCDVLYIYLRNFAIMRAANSKKYIFSNKDISNYLSITFGKIYGDLYTTLRPLKATYRSGKYTNNVPLSHELIQNLNTVLGRRTPLTFEESAPIKYFNLPYVRLREIESRWRASQANVPKNTLIYEWHHAIGNPNAYNRFVKQISRNDLLNLEYEFQKLEKPHL